MVIGENTRVALALQRTLATQPELTNDDKITLLLATVNHMMNALNIALSKLDVLSNLVNVHTNNGIGANPLVPTNYDKLVTAVDSQGRIISYTFTLKSALVSVTTVTYNTDGSISYSVTPSISIGQIVTTPAPGNSFSCGLDLTSTT